MTPVHCVVNDDQPNGKYGDCLRACVASILDLQADDVPHFFIDGCDGPEGHKRLAEFLECLGQVPFYTAYDGSLCLGDVIEYQKQNNPNAHYILFGITADGASHCVVCRGGEVVHDPAWIKSGIVAPTNENWLIMVIAKA